MVFFLLSFGGLVFYSLIRVCFFFFGRFPYGRIFVFCFFFVLLPYGWMSYLG